MSEELTCMVCKGKIGVGEEDVDMEVECGSCFSVFVVHKKNDGKLALDYPEIGESESLSVRESPG